MFALLNTKYLTIAALPNINTIKPDVFNNGATADKSSHYEKPEVFNNKGTPSQ